MAEELEIGDSRVEFMAVYLLKTLKLKNDKWMKMYGNEDNKVIINDFFEKTDLTLIVFYMSVSGALTVQYTYPTQIKSKVAYFAKKNKDSIQKETPIREALIYGDL